MAVWRLGDTKQRGTRSAVRKQVQRWTRGQGLNRRGVGGSTGKFIFEPFDNFGILWYCRSTLIGRSVVVLWWRCLPPLWREGEGGASVAEGEGARYTVVLHQGVLLSRPS